MKRKLIYSMAVFVLMITACTEDFNSDIYDVQNQFKATSITVRARGTAGSEQLRLTVGGSTVTTWNLTTSMQNYTASTNATGSVRVEFINDDGTNRDVQVDYAQYNGTTYQAENQATNTAVWQNSSCGGSNSEWMHCGGYIQFPDISAGGGGGGSEVWLEAE